uniref:Uncharacterized protein n=1 Tax=Glossina pallidipes TaxID=7398 RepID=A0A1A9ZR52_GLOPL
MLFHDGLIAISFLQKIDLSRLELKGLGTRLDNFKEARKEVMKPPGMINTPLHRTTTVANNIENVDESSNIVSPSNNVCSIIDCTDYTDSNFLVEITSFKILVLASHYLLILVGNSGLMGWLLRTLYLVGLLEYRVVISFQNNTLQQLAKNFLKQTCNNKSYKDWIVDQFCKDFADEMIHDHIIIHTPHNTASFTDLQKCMPTSTEILLIAGSYGAMAKTVLITKENSIEISKDVQIPWVEETIIYSPALKKLKGKGAFSEHENRIRIDGANRVLVTSKHSQFTKTPRVGDKQSSAFEYIWTFCKHLPGLQESCALHIKINCGPRQTVMEKLSSSKVSIFPINHSNCCVPSSHETICRRVTCSLFIFRRKQYSNCLPLPGLTRKEVPNNYQTKLLVTSAAHRQRQQNSQFKDFAYDVYFQTNDYPAWTPESMEMDSEN